MLELSYIREQSDRVRQSLADRGESLSLEPLLELDRVRREMLVEVERLKQTRNERSREIGSIVKSGGDAEPAKREVRELGERITVVERRLDETSAELDRRLTELPNVPHDSVPIGRQPQDNPVVRRWGEKPEFAREPLPHWEVGTRLGILDFERAAKISGARFAVLVGDGALLERALIQFMLDLHTREHGYTEVLPPFMVNSRSLFGTGQLPKFAGDLFRTDPGELWLIPTAEVPLTNLHADEILTADELPRAYCAYTPCFRSEAGSYGKDVRGLIRQHQFDKVELVRFCEPERSYEDLEALTGHAERVLQRLELPYRVVTLCTGDLGFSAAKTYDLEVWLPAQRCYREISSCSNFEAFQARRAKIRYRPAQGDKPRPLHTLNGSGLAVGRTMVAILENCQQADGSVRIPEVLRTYMHGKTRIEPRGTE
ncbi:MAG TPA: serine--tRNA ligase [Candidatus Polarisedimenticolaceae bacterium]|nr:serine--tRNA ligase [Candidatus Polarisedimenticolaceae bacterium]